MSLGDSILGGLRSIVLIEERLQRLNESLANLRREAVAAVADHEKRLIRLETIIELHRPDGTTLRIASPGGGAGE
ncbi:MAG: hypothetical protein GC185_11655 [Alphaproteobacteria bacterium]|nr:hypothetical protein [Alphaproteobacteria bacterium]